jgi:membrane-associated protease RseP (regulator of RpoE activity)
MTTTSDNPGTTDPNADPGVSPGSAFPPPAPSTHASEHGLYSKFRSEMVAGGAVEATPPADTTSAVIGGVVILGLLAWLGVTNPWMLLFVVGILISIFLHEVGHFVTAKWAGMKVTQFFMGFGPKIWSRHSGEVEYGLRSIPAGAFVRIVGMSSADEVDPADEARTYRQKSYPWRLLVITAGSIMHMIIAFVLLFGVFATAGHVEEVGQVTIAAPPGEGSPADVAGLLEGDVVLAIDGESMETREEFVRTIQTAGPDAETVLTVQRDGETFDVPVVLDQNPSITEPTGYLGVSSTSDDWVDKNVFEAAGLAVSEMGRGVTASVKGVFTVLNPVNIWNHLTGATEDISTRPTTMVGATQVSGFLGEEEGLKGVLIILAGVNVFVGVFNMLPLLPFDGGHAAIATYERLRSRNGKRYFADVNKMMPVVVVVLALVGFLFFTGLYLDITKPL